MKMRYLFTAIAFLWSSPVFCSSEKAASEALQKVVNHVDAVTEAVNHRDLDKLKMVLVGGVEPFDFEKIEPFLSSIPNAVKYSALRVHFEFGQALAKLEGQNPTDEEIMDLLGRSGIGNEIPMMLQFTRKAVTLETPRATRSWSDEQEQPARGSVYGFSAKANREGLEVEKKYLAAKRDLTEQMIGLKKSLVWVERAANLVYWGFTSLTAGAFGIFFPDAIPIVNAHETMGLSIFTSTVSAVGYSIFRPVWSRVRENAYQRWYADRIAELREAMKKFGEEGGELAAKVLASLACPDQARGAAQIQSQVISELALDALLKVNNKFTTHHLFRVLLERLSHNNTESASLISKEIRERSPTSAEAQVLNDMEAAFGDVGKLRGETKKQHFFTALKRAGLLTGVITFGLGAGFLVLDTEVLTAYAKIAGKFAVSVGLVTFLANWVLDYKSSGLSSKELAERRDGLTQSLRMALDSSKSLEHARQLVDVVFEMIFLQKDSKRDHVIREAAIEAFRGTRGNIAVMRAIELNLPELFQRMDLMDAKKLAEILEQEVLECIRLHPEGRYDE